VARSRIRAFATVAAAFGAALIALPLLDGRPIVVGVLCVGWGVVVLASALFGLLARPAV
jgi:hypothetical protein